MSIVSDIRDDVNSILTLRDQIGAVKHPVYIMTRVWAGEKGVGTPVDSFIQILPSPRIVNFAHNYNVKEGGNIKQGDLLLKGISQQTYPLETSINCSVDSAQLERWYCIDGYLYEFVNAEKKYVTWNALIRKTSKNRVNVV